jgi:TatA/E family protein of Tat protein translocase
VIGPLEIAIVVVIILLFIGYRKLPELGRKAGTGARELKDSVTEAVGDKADPETLGRSAGRGIREAREFRDALTGKSPPKAGEAPAREPTRPGDAEPAPAERKRAGEDENA